MDCLLDAGLNVGDTTEKQNQSNTGCILKGSLSNGDDGFMKRPFKDKIAGEGRGPEVSRDKVGEEHLAQLSCVREGGRERENKREEKASQFRGFPS